MSKQKFFMILFVGIFTNFLLGCANQMVVINLNKGLTIKAKLVFSDNFDKGLNNWVAEQNEASKLSIINEKLDIQANSGSTVWYTKKMESPLMITYDAVIVDKGGANDRVSDLNCFWLATDPKNPNGLFTDTAHIKGKFEVYDQLHLYYVGFGGHNNTKTRFRKYLGNGEKPIMPEHDLSNPNFLIIPNKVNHIKIIVFNERIKFYHNDQLIYNIVDKDPYRFGYFAFRGTRNHTVIDNFKVFKLIKLREKS